MRFITFIYHDVLEGILYGSFLARLSATKVHLVFENKSHLLVSCIYLNYMSSNNDYSIQKFMKIGIFPTAVFVIEIQFL